MQRAEVGCHKGAPVEVIVGLGCAGMAGPPDVPSHGAWWVQYRPDNARGESRLRHYRRTLNGIGILNVEWTPYPNPQLIGLVPPAIAEAEASTAVVCPLLCFAIVEWHQVAYLGPPSSF
ncbi:hypothetical protein AHAS_Ahas11G0143900 [Arachis hypogaea]